jgi:hypothetical protein
MQTAKSAGGCVAMRLLRTFQGVMLQLSCHPKGFVALESVVTEFEFTRIGCSAAMASSLAL